ncbi:MAG: heavy metal translocating P-type ATPase metal-binding domain-containing protein [Lunatimonas sp.]|uniref:heavy metal translocating P-type ATPase n=1 Tax=Lunatimonas sp. TaxID=2060141 RepID=UPI00263A4DBD|nr:heavy metal translocating P-type ATPase metal-binding domain-containing protein [Lunatimonas sp.]MCC5939386.1 heavy metal translocating P-type ATPase metal-binding domain-containing protein [Lunatimonas sp.]
MSRKSKIDTTDSIKTCYHCGDTCKEELVQYHDKDFCCTGCRLVYEVLNENDLCNYYDLEAAPGGSQRNVQRRDDRFDYLTDVDVNRKLLDFLNAEESHVTFFVPLIHCASCIWLLENLHKLHDGVVSGRVDFLRKKVQVKFRHDKLSLRDLVLLLSRIGYEPSINLSDIDKKEVRTTDRRLVYKLAVAGFCFGNMMFFSLPEYFSEAELLGDGFKGLFSYLNVLLALPVFFYSASDYYRSAWYALKNRVVNMDVPIVLGIIALFFFSLYEIFVSGNEGYLDTLGGLLFFLLLGKLYQQKTYDTLSFDRDYKSYFPIAVTRLKQDREEVIPLTKLEVGDRIRVRHEELIPADSILIEGQAHIDYSFVTGEEVPVVKRPGELVYAGGRQKGSSVTLTVQKSPSQGYLTDLWNNKAFDKKKTDSLETLANRISGKFTFTILAIAFAGLAYWGVSDLAFGVKVFTSVLIIACPCALAMSTPFTLGNTLRIFGAGKLYLKNAHVIERMAEVDTVVFDKTGTLTDPARASIRYEGEPLSADTKAIVKSLVARSIHPLSNRINAWLEGVEEASVADVEELKGKGLRGVYSGQEVRLGSAEFCGVESFPAEEGNQVFLSVEGLQLGVFLIKSGLREGIDKTIRALGEDKVIHILSGDQGHERGNLQRVFGDRVIMNFDQSPAQKLAYIRSLSVKGRKTLMVGDGLNDAGALKEAHVGVALTAKATGFTPASDGIMDADTITRLPDYLGFAGVSRRIVKASFGLSFAYNVVGVSFAVQGLVSPVFCAVLMPLSSISVVVFTTLATNYMAHRKGIKNKFG